jgi:hypothetical protein
MESTLEDFANDLHRRLLRLARTVAEFEQRASDPHRSEWVRMEYAAMRHALGAARRAMRDGITLAEDVVGGALLRAGGRE